MAKAILRQGAQKRTEYGHPWVYRTEVDHFSGDPTPGDIVDVETAKGKFLGRGYFNPRSQMVVRIMTRLPEEIDQAFFVRRISEAIAFRRRFLAGVESYRLVYGEADGLPALIVDKFGDYLVVQILALGMEVRRDWIVQALIEGVQPKGIYERSDVGVRKLEGLEERTGFLYGSFDPVVEFTENDLRLLADLKHGQKTGYFFDQRENRAAIRDVSQGARVLDCFCHTGSFALSAAKYGAVSVLGSDISETAVEMARRNALLNGLDQVCTFESGNAFDRLRQMEEEKVQFDTVILDPPAFTKNRAAVEQAARGYKEINLRAMKLMPNPGYLVTCSCSYHVDQALFLEIINRAAHDARREARLVEFRTAGKDHPVLLGSTETNYLKFAILEIR